MKRTYEKEKAQPVASVKPTTLNLQTRGFAPPQTNLDEEIPRQSKGSTSENLLKKLISNPSSESSTEPIQRKSQNRLKASQTKISTLIQAKLNIGEPNDKYEQEADATASKVVQQINSSTQDQSVQRQESMEEDEELQMKPISKIQRQESMEEEDELQMKSLVQKRENLGGGEASTDLESSIQSARGGGQSLDTGLQEKMGQAMGADFSGVKVHTDSQSDQLNKSIQAKAFTTGQDVFFRQGAYEPSSRGGQELIAHELTHVVQQNSSSVQRTSVLNHTTNNVQSKVFLQRKLDWQNTNWNSTKYIDPSTGGSSGVLFFGEDGNEVAVKTGEDTTVEATLAAFLHNEVGQEQDHGILAPGLRVVSTQESKLIKQVAEQDDLLKAVGSRGEKAEIATFKKNRAKEQINGLGKSGVMVQEAVSGKEFAKALDDIPKHTKKGVFGKRKLRSNSPLSIFTDKRAIQALGAATATDILMGNSDRIFLYNDQNFLVDAENRIKLIDNIQMWDKSFWKTTVIKPGEQDSFTVTREQGIQDWKSYGYVNDLAAGNFDSIATKAFDTIKRNAAQNLRQEDRKGFEKIMQSKKKDFISSFKRGLAQGKSKLIDVLGDLLKNPNVFFQLVPGLKYKEQNQMIQSITYRRNFLINGS